jgi:hypothetical protein
MRVSGSKGLLLPWLAASPPVAALLAVAAVDVSIRVLLLILKLDASLGFFKGW